MGNKEYEDLLIEEQESEADRTFYREEIGTFESDPEINRRIREQIKSNDLETRAKGVVTPQVLERAIRIVNLNRSTREYIPQPEILRRLSELRRVGYPVSGYSNMSSRRAFGYFMGVARRIQEQYAKIQAS